MSLFLLSFFNQICALQRQLNKRQKESGKAFPLRQAKQISYKSGSDA